jgi:hypothetical protein
VFGPICWHLLYWDIHHGSVTLADLIHTNSTTRNDFGYWFVHEGDKFVEELADLWFII